MSGYPGHLFKLAAQKGEEICFKSSKTEGPRPPDSSPSPPHSGPYLRARGLGPRALVCHVGNPKPSPFAQRDFPVLLGPLAEERWLIGSNSTSRSIPLVQGTGKVQGRWGTQGEKKTWSCIQKPHLLGRQDAGGLVGRASELPSQRRKTVGLGESRLLRD